jgi:hypothetical protein
VKISCIPSWETPVHIFLFWSNTVVSHLYATEKTVERGYVRKFTCVFLSGYIITRISSLLIVTNLLFLHTLSCRPCWVLLQYSLWYHLMDGLENLLRPILISATACKYLCAIYAQNLHGNRLKLST